MTPKKRNCRGYCFVVCQTSDNICILPVCTSTMPVPKPWLKETSTFGMVCASIFWDSDSCDLHVIQGGFKPGTVHVGCPRPGRPRGPRIKKSLIPSYDVLKLGLSGSFWYHLPGIEKRWYSTGYPMFNLFLLQIGQLCLSQKDSLCMGNSKLSFPGLNVWPCLTPPIHSNSTYPWHIMTCTGCTDACLEPAGFDGLGIIRQEISHGGSGAVAESWRNRQHLSHGVHRWTHWSDRFQDTLW